VVKLAQKQSRPFSITIAGSYTVPKGQEQIALELPRPVGWGSERFLPAGSPAIPAGSPLPIFDRGGQVKVTMLEGLELTSRQFRLTPEIAVQNPFQSFLLPLRGKPPTREYSWQAERLPERVDLTWQEYRPDLSVHSVCDLFLNERQCRIRQRLKFEAQSALAQSNLHIPSGLAGKVRLLSGGTLQKPASDDPSELVVNFIRPTSREQEVELEYAFALPDWKETNSSGQNPAPSGGPDPVRSRLSRRFAV